MIRNIIELGKEGTEIDVAIPTLCFSPSPLILWDFSLMLLPFGSASQGQCERAISSLKGLLPPAWSTQS